MWLRALLVLLAGCGGAQPAVPERPTGVVHDAPASLPRMLVEAATNEAVVKDTPARVQLPARWALRRIGPQHLQLTRHVRLDSTAAINPTADVLVEPVAPRYDALALNRAQLARAFAHVVGDDPSAVVAPAHWAGTFGPEGLVGSGTVEVAGRPVEVVWRYYDASSRDLHFVIAAVCAARGEQVCEEEFGIMVRSFTESIEQGRSGPRASF